MKLRTSDVTQNTKAAFWPRLSRSTGTYVDFVADTLDIAVRVRADPRPAKVIAEKPRVSAWWRPSDRVLFIDGNFVFKGHHFVDSHLSLMSKDHREAYPVFTGVLAHELSHALHTKYVRQNIDASGKPVTALEKHVVELLEESRCEFNLAKHRPENASYIKFIIPRLAYEKGFEALDNIQSGKISGNRLKLGVLNLNLLVIGRVLAGNLEESTIPDEIVQILKSGYTSEQLASMRERMNDVYACGDTDFEGILRVARNVIAALGIGDMSDDEVDDSEYEECSHPGMGGGEFHTSQEEEGEGEEDEDTIVQDGSPMSSKKGQPKESGEEGESSDSDESDDAEGESGKSGQDSDEDEDSDDEAGWPTYESNPEAAKKAQEITVEFIREKERAGKKKTDPFKKDREERQAKKEYNRKAQKNAEQIKSTGSVKQKGGWHGNNRPWDGRITTRKPTSQENTAALVLEQAIRRAQFRDLTTAEVESQTPPGRFVRREAMNLQIQRTMGLAETASPWRYNRYMEHENPPLHVGIAVDMSGSMEEWMDVVSGYAWSLSQAVRRNQGKVSSIFWDNNSYRGVTPDIFSKEVMKPSDCHGGSYGLPQALLTLSGVAGFMHEEGAKLAIVLTDSELPDMDAIRGQLDMMNRMGVRVLWISTSSDGSGFVEGYGKHAMLRDANDFSRIVTPTIVDILENTHMG